MRLQDYVAEHPTFFAVLLIIVTFALFVCLVAYVMQKMEKEAAEQRVESWIDEYRLLKGQKESVAFAVWYHMQYGIKWNEYYASDYQYAMKVGDQYQEWCKLWKYEPVWDG
jgi:hypothetical protein